MASGGTSPQAPGKEWLLRNLRPDFPVTGPFLQVRIPRGSLDLLPAKRVRELPEREGEAAENIPDKIGKGKASRAL